MSALHLPIIKQVGANGQISLGKKYAGKHISITEQDDGTLILKAGSFIPDNEAWLYASNGEDRVDNAIKWHNKTIRRDNYDEIVEKLENV